MRQSSDAKELHSSIASRRILCNARAFINEIRPQTGCLKSREDKKYFPQYSDSETAKQGFSEMESCCLNSSLTQAVQEDVLDESALSISTTLHSLSARTDDEITSNASGIDILGEDSYRIGVQNDLNTRGDTDSLCLDTSRPPGACVTIKSLKGELWLSCMRSFCSRCRKGNDVGHPLRPGEITRGLRVCISATASGDASLLVEAFITILFCMGNTNGVREIYSLVQVWLNEKEERDNHEIRDGSCRTFRGEIKCHFLIGFLHELRDLLKQDLNIHQSGSKDEHPGFDLSFILESIFRQDYAVVIIRRCVKLLSHSTFNIFAKEFVGQGCAGRHDLGLDQSSTNVEVIEISYLCIFIGSLVLVTIACAFSSGVLSHASELPEMIRNKTVLPTSATIDKLVCGNPFQEVNDCVNERNSFKEKSSSLLTEDTFLMLLVNLLSSFNERVLETVEILKQSLSSKDCSLLNPAHQNFVMDDYLRYKNFEPSTLYFIFFLLTKSMSSLLMIVRILCDKHPHKVVEAGILPVIGQILSNCLSLSFISESFCNYNNIKHKLSLDISTWDLAARILCRLSLVKDIASSLRADAARWISFVTSNSMGKDLVLTSASPESSTSCLKDLILFIVWSRCGMVRHCNTSMIRSASCESSVKAEMLFKPCTGDDSKVHESVNSLSRARALLALNIIVGSNNEIIPFLCEMKLSSILPDVEPFKKYSAACGTVANAFLLEIRRTLECFCSAQNIADLEKSLLGEAGPVYKAECSSDLSLFRFGSTESILEIDLLLAALSLLSNLTLNKDICQSILSRSGSMENSASSSASCENGAHLLKDTQLAPSLGLLLALVDIFMRSRREEFSTARNLVLMCISNVSFFFKDFGTIKQDYKKQVYACGEETEVKRACSRYSMSQLVAAALCDVVNRCRDYESVVEATRALGNISATTDGRAWICKSRFENDLLCLLNSSDERLVYNTLGILVNIFSTPEENNKNLNSDFFKEPQNVATLLRRTKELITEDSVSWEIKDLIEMLLKNASSSL